MDDETQYWNDVQSALGTAGRNKSVFRQLERKAGNAARRLSTEWWKEQVKQLGAINEKGLYLSEKRRHRQNVMVGKLYHWFYDAKHKKTLPYYDRFPLTWVFHRDAKYIWGINMHYLPLKQRIILLDKMQLLASDNRFDARTKVLISWKILKNVSKYPEVRPCVKKYLRSQVRSKYMLIHPDDWIKATLLPSERFAKASKKEVWVESKNAIKAAKRESRKNKRSTRKKK